MEQLGTETYDSWKPQFDLALQSMDEFYSRPGSDNLTMATFARAARAVLNVDAFNEIIEHLYDGQQPITPAYATNLILRAYQADQLAHNPEYPDGFDTETRWLAAFDEVENDFDRWGNLVVTVRHRQVQSNIAERYKTVQLFASLMRDRLGEHPSHLDVGSSVMQGGVKLAFSNVTESGRPLFSPVEIVRDDLIVDNRLSHLANLAISLEVAYGTMVGTDITNVDDPVIQEWVKSCSFYPDELRDPSKIAEYETLEQLDPLHERVQFFRSDFANEQDFQEFREWSPVSTFDIITFSTILYQVSKDDRIEMLKHAADLLSNEGMILIQDAPDGKFTSAYNYRASVIDALDPASDPQEMLRWQTGRCKRAMLGLGEISFNGVSKQTLEEALLAQERA